MGKRKSSRKPGAGRVKQLPLDKSFRCNFCQHPATVSCKLDQKTKIGRLSCKDCGQSFVTEINHLTEPIDVYSDWIDACKEAKAKDELNRRARQKEGRIGRPDNDDDDDNDEQEEEAQERDMNRRKLSNKRAAVDDDEDDDDDLPDMRPKQKQLKGEDAAGEEDFPDIRPRGKEASPIGEEDEQDDEPLATRVIAPRVEDDEEE